MFDQAHLLYIDTDWWSASYCSCIVSTYKVVDKQIEWQFTLNLGMVKRNQGVHTLAASGLLQFAVKLMDMSLSRRQLQLFRRKTNRNHFISSAPSISAKIPTFRHLAIKWLRLQRRHEWGAEIESLNLCLGFKSEKKKQKIVNPVSCPVVFSPTFPLCFLSISTENFNDVNYSCPVEVKLLQFDLRIAS